MTSRGDIKLHRASLVLYNSLPAFRIFRHSGWLVINPDYLIVPLFLFFFSLGQFWTLPFSRWYTVTTVLWLLELMTMSGAVQIVASKKRILRTFRKLAKVFSIRWGGRRVDQSSNKTMYVSEMAFFSLETNYWIFLSEINHHFLSALWSNLTGGWTNPTFMGKFWIL